MGTITLRFFIENLKKAEPRIKTVEEAVRFFHILVEGTGDGKRGGWVDYLKYWHRDFSQFSFPE